MVNLLPAIENWWCGYSCIIPCAQSVRAARPQENEWAKIRESELGISGETFSAHQKHLCSEQLRANSVASGSKQRVETRPSSYLCQSLPAFISPTAVSQDKSSSQPPCCVPWPSQPPYPLPSLRS